ncbi:MAG TPA: LysM peptidoglycan-binding domain-containing protein [Chlamydiales bacterium]|nr:LysM peptidoglycan-binding domain-containing protein [Chlamydiales bacterium]
MERRRWNKFRILTVALIFSAALNIGLGLAFILSVLEKEATPLIFAKLEEESSVLSNAHMLEEMLKFSFSELLVCLTNHDPVEDGYLKRDLALAALVGAHYFNLEKALASLPLQKRTLCLSPQKSIELYPNLTDEHYEAIIRYGYQETWPLTSKGLFLGLANRQKGFFEKSLVEAFFATAEFHSIQILFQKTNCQEAPDTLLDLVLEGPWEILQDFANEQKKILDLSVEKRRALLLSYFAHHSPTAAQLLLRTDFAFSKTRLADEAILLLLDLLQEKTETAERFCKELLDSLRKDAVLQAASKKLYAFAGEIPPSSFDLNEARVHFGSQPASLLSIQAPRFQEHIVQEGENLWKISRQYKVKVEDLIQHNGLEQDRLLPGMVLRIP